MRDKIILTLEQIEKAEGVWEQNQNGSAKAQPPIWGMKTKYASVPRRTGMFLRDLILEQKPKMIFEIGGSVGYSTLWMALAAEQIGAHIYTTEINSGRIALAKKHHEMAAAQKNITLYERDAKEILKQFANENKSIDFVFLDAFKKDYPEYIELIWPVLTAQGTIVLDNIQTHYNILKSFVEKISNDSRFSARKIDQDNGILVLSKAG